jgi:hypothetical protein
MAEARLNKEYAWRLLGVGLVMALLSGWSVYDGLVGWPRLNARVEAVRPALLATNLTAEAWLLGEMPAQRPLHQVFAARGWLPPRKLVRKMGELRLPRRPEDAGPALTSQRESVRRLLKEPLYSAEDLRAQFIQAGITLLLALAAVGTVVWKQGRRYVADEAGLRGSGFGGSHDWSELVSVDWSRWDEKGIVVLTFASGVSVRCDGWHYAGMPGIVAVIETQRSDLARGPRAVSSIQNSDSRSTKPFQNG